MMKNLIRAMRVVIVKPFDAEREVSRSGSAAVPSAGACYSIDARIASVVGRSPSGSWPDPARPR